MHTISKRFSFSASHQLSHLPDGHKCARLHGHNYEVEVTLASDALDARGFVMDYAELEPFKRLLDDRLDHRHLNSVLPMLWTDINEHFALPQLEHDAAKLTTAENLSVFFFHWCRLKGWPIKSASVSETPKTVATHSAV